MVFLINSLHSSLIVYPIDVKSTDLLASLIKSEKQFCKWEDISKYSYTVIIFAALAWTLPQGVLQIAPYIMRLLKMSQKLEVALSPNLLSHESYKLLGTPVSCIYLHVRLDSFLNAHSKFPI